MIRGNHDFSGPHAASNGAKVEMDALRPIQSPKATSFALIGTTCRRSSFALELGAMRNPPVSIATESNAYTCLQVPLR